jgi:predicted nucleic acid-binding protein
MLYDTEFLIAYAHGYKGVGKVRAAKFLAENGSSPTYISRVTWMEIAAGHERPAALKADTHLFTILEIDEVVAWQASRIRRYLRRLGTPIGDNDIWIAATALCYGLPVVTNNVTHFGRVPDLKILTY